MADFSCEYGLDVSDFSIQNEYDKLKEGYFIQIICEGFGFTAIAKINNTCKVYINDEWKDFDFISNSIR